MKNILIYPHSPFQNEEGGIVVQYYLAQLLEESGLCVRMYNSRGSFPDCQIFNKFYDNDFPIDDNCVVIYCEGIEGNPLNAKYIVRWMLSELGQNISYDALHTWGKNELVYHFNTELKFKNHPEKVGNIYKTLSTIYLFPEIKNKEQPNRSGWCHTFRKVQNIHKNGIQHIHPPDSFEICHNRYAMSMNDVIDIFNKHEYFVSYDAITFLSCIAPFCGCISIVYPIEGKTKFEWLYMTAFAEYMEYKQIDNIYGIAYGMEDLEWAKNTIHLFKDQLDDILKYYKETHVKSFIEDIHNFESMQNTIENVYYK